jgi:hypothetical protein
MLSFPVMKPFLYRQRVFMYFWTGFGQNFLPRVQAVDSVDRVWSWPDRVRSMARLEGTGTKKTKPEIGLHHGIFQFHHLGEK